MMRVLCSFDVGMDMDGKLANSYLLTSLPPDDGKDFSKVSRISR